jgi:phage shock protein E
MKYVIILAIALVFVFMMVACASKAPAATPGITSQLITPAEAKRRLDTEQGIVLVDVRTAEEYAAGHIPGSKLIPVESITAEAPAKLPDKNAVLFVYCRSGRRSAIAAADLMKMGYTQVYDLGGINSWPYEVVKS